MPVVTKLNYISVEVKDFLRHCSPAELFELMILLQSPMYAGRMSKISQADQTRILNQESSPVKEELNECISTSN